MNKYHLFDKVASLLLVVFGLLFLYLTNAQGNMQLVGIGVVLGGVLGLVNAQAIAPFLALIEKQLGVTNSPLGVPSASTPDTQSQEGSSTTLSVTSQVQDTQAGTNGAIVAAPGTRL